MNSDLQVGISQIEYGAAVVLYSLPTYEPASHLSDGGRQQ
jgi:hypothetical protein